MFTDIRLFVVASLATALLALSCGDAFAAQPAAAVPGPIWRSAMALVPGESRVLKQAVASTTESKLLVGTLTGAAIVAGVALVAYGATSSCKGAHGASACDRNAVIGALSLSGGTVALVIWSLSK